MQVSEHPLYLSMLLGSKIYVKMMVEQGNPLLRNKVMWGYTESDEDGKIHLKRVVQAWHEDPHHSYLFYAIKKKPSMQLSERWKVSLTQIRKEEYVSQCVKQEKFWSVMHTFLETGHRYQVLHGECQRLWLQDCGINLEKEIRATLTIRRLEEEMNSMVVLELAEKI